MKSRSQLKKEGILLEGPIVPLWFKNKSDKCSVPTRLAKWGLRAEVYGAGCFIHDWDYYIANISYEPKSPEWRKALKEADRRLRRNVKRIKKPGFWSMGHGIAYYVGVRLGGIPTALKKSDIPDLWKPPTVKAIDHVIMLCEATPRTERVKKYWIDK